MKQIVPIVGISKIIDAYDTVVCGFDGVLSKGEELFDEALSALCGISGAGKEVIILSNSPLRIQKVAKMLVDAHFDLRQLKAIITAGEILHYILKNTSKFGRKYYNLGDNSDIDIFANTGYQKVLDIGQADFIFIGGVDESKMEIEDYMAEIQTAVARGLCLICAGMDVSAHIKGDVCISSGAIAEQYATSGGKIMTVGKPDAKVLLYMKENFQLNQKKVLWIGDSLSADIKSASAFKADSVLVAQGIHVHTLGTGVVADVQNARYLAMSYEIYPDYLISKLRF